jgi:S-adenosylmethionine decarboxylase
MEKIIHKFEWKHFIFDFRKATKNSSFLTNQEDIESIIKKLVGLIKATLILCHSHKFWDKWGISGMWILEESHISIHTYPEFKWAMVDIFTCWDIANPFAAKDFLLDFFKPKDIRKLMMVIRWGG